MLCQYFGHKWREGTMQPRMSAFELPECNGPINAHQQQCIAVSYFKTLQSVYLSRADRSLGRIASPFMGELAMHTTIMVRNRDTFN